MNLFFRFLFSFNFDWEDISNTQDSVWPHFQYLEVRQKYSATHRIFNSPLGVLRCDQTRYFVFDILHMLQADDMTQLCSLFQQSCFSWRQQPQILMVNQLMCKRKQRLKTIYMLF